MIEVNGFSSRQLIDPASIVRVKESPAHSQCRCVLHLNDGTAIEVRDDYETIKKLISKERTDE